VASVLIDPLIPSEAALLTPETIAASICGASGQRVPLGGGQQDPGLSHGSLPVAVHLAVGGRDGGVLLDEAVRTHAVRSGVVVTDLLKLVGAISLATEQEPDGATQADRLIALAFDGVRATRPSP
jgi:hypothetical protein